jgi:hypothetical protein
MLKIVCINVKNYLGRGIEYVDTLYDMVTRNLSEGTPGDFIVFTDDVSEVYSPGITVREVPHELRGWFSKLSLFKTGTFNDGDRIFYLDLDSVITASLDDIVAYTGPFAILRDAYRPDGLQSSVMLWEAGECDYIWRKYANAGFPEVFGGDQAWIEEVVEDYRILQTEFPRKFVSYKRDARMGVPPGASVVFFHGLPRPHEAGGWVEKVWKVGGATSAQLELVGNTDADIVAKNIIRAEGIEGALWLEAREPHHGIAVICAGGPSLVEEITSIRHQSVLGEIFACNGAALKLKEFGVTTDFHVILDARPENVQFVGDIGPFTTRLYASQCDKSVHDAAGGSLVLWHPAFPGVLDIVGANKERAYIGGGTTCGMKAASIAWAMGYRKIHLYGFDSCYRGDRHHAYRQTLNDGETVLDVEYAGEIYKCSPWMIQQAEDFETFAPQLMDNGVELSVHGSGLIPAIAAQFSQGIFRPEAADFRALAILERLQGVEEPKVAEIGVFAGDLSRRLLARRDDLHLTMIDSWAEAPKAEYAASDDFHASLRADQQEHYFDLTKRVTAFAGQRAKIMRADSKVAAGKIADASLDLVFIDADHSYEGCRDDILAWYDKVKPGGIISGHDYGNDDWKFGPMVKRAVDEFVQSHGLELELGENFTWFCTKPQLEDAA